jgi:integrase
MATIRKRGTRWQVQVRRKGEHPQSKSFINRKDAEAWARQTEIQADRRELPQDPRQLERYTLGELVIRYRDTVTPNKRAAKVETIVLNAFLRHPICAKRLSNLSATDFASYRDERLKEVKAYSLKRMLSPIQNLFEVAKSEWRLPIRDNPISKLKIACLNNRRERRLREGELDLIKNAASTNRNSLVLPIILFALETGLRRSEILAATWNDLDAANRLLMIPRAKNGHSRSIPLTLNALRILEQLKSGNSERKGRIFPTTANALRLSWERLTTRARVEGLHFHDLRHEAISRFFELGLTAPEVALISGHRDMRMLYRYAHPLHTRILGQLDRTNTLGSAMAHYSGTTPDAPNPLK